MAPAIQVQLPYQRVSLVVPSHCHELTGSAPTIPYQTGVHGTTALPVLTEKLNFVGAIVHLGVVGLDNNFHKRRGDGLLQRKFLEAVVLLEIVDLFGAVRELQANAVVMFARAATLHVPELDHSRFVEIGLDPTASAFALRGPRFAATVLMDAVERVDALVVAVVFSRGGT